MLRHLLFSALAFGLAPPAAAQTPSFDCDRARTPTEFAICADATLAQLDQQMADSYFRSLAENTDANPQKEAEQAVWRDWRNTCADDRACLERRYRARVAELNPGVGPLVEPTGPSDADGATPAADAVILRFRDGRYERITPDGVIRWNDPINGTSGTTFPNGTSLTNFFVTSPPAEFPGFPPDGQAWVSELETNLSQIVLSLLPPEDHDRYRDLQADFATGDRINRHVDALRFLSN